jgi:hypothetical protein
MTAEYRTAQKLREPLETEYALLSYRLPYVGDVGYLEDQEEEEEQPKTPEIEDVYRMKAAYPQLPDNVEAVSVTLIRYYIKLKKITE